MAKYAFTEGFFNTVKPQRCTTEPVKPLDGYKKDVSNAKLLLKATCVDPVDCACFWPLLKTQHYCLCPNRSCSLPLASHSPPYTRHSCIAVAVKKLLKIQQC